MPIGSSTYGEALWGGAFEVSAARALYMIRMGTRVRALCDLIDTRWARIIAALNAVRTGFDLDSAVGVQLDVLGAMIGREREGMTDARYRRALRVQVIALSSATGTTPGILRVFEAWIGTAAANYRNVPPAYVEIGGDVDPADESLLRRFLELVVPGGVRLSVVGAVPDAAGYLLADSVVDPLADPGVVDCVATPVDDARPVAYEVT